MDGVSFGFLTEKYIRDGLSSCKKALGTEESEQLVCRLSRDFQTAEYQLCIATAFLFHVECKEISGGDDASLREVLSCMSQLIPFEQIPAASEAHCVMTANRGMNEAVMGVKGFHCKPDGAAASPV